MIEIDFFKFISGSKSFDDAEIIQEDVPTEMIENYDKTYQEVASDSETDSTASELSTGPMPRETTRLAAKLFKDRSALEGNLPIFTLTNNSLVHCPLTVTESDVISSGFTMRSIVHVGGETISNPMIDVEPAQGIHAHPDPVVSQLPVTPRNVRLVFHQDYGITHVNQ